MSNCNIETDEQYFYRLAVHEAGHAVIARRLKMDVAHVEIGLEEEIGGQTMIAMYSTFKDRGILKKEIACLMAGKWAEQMILGGYYPDYTGDQSIIDRTMAAFPASKKVKARFLDKSEDEACNLVCQSAEDIKKVASALIERHKLSGAEVDRIMKETPV